MKTNYVLFCALALCTLLSSCGASYKFVQICTVKPVANATAAQEREGIMVYENQDCRVSYHLWKEGGDAGFDFYNKTDQVIHIDLSQTFFVKNGEAYDYYIPSIITQTTSSNVSLGVAPYGLALIGSSYGGAESVSTETPTIVSIPPKTSRSVSHHTIREQQIYDCDLNGYPVQSANLTYSFDNSPLTFANYITYIVGDNRDKQSIDNQFYISEVANYAIPYITTFAPHPKTCDNMLTPGEQKSKKNIPELYDASLNVDNTDKFFIHYSVVSFYKLYDTPKEYWQYVWNSTYNAYTNSYLNRNNSHAK